MCSGFELADTDSTVRSQKPYVAGCMRQKLQNHIALPVTEGNEPNSVGLCKAEINVSNICSDFHLPVRTFDVNFVSGLNVVCYRRPDLR